MANPLFKISMGLDAKLPSGKVPGQVYVTTDKKKMHIDIDGDTRIVLNAAEADIATKLQTPRSIYLTGSVTGACAFDGSSDVNINTITNHNHDTLYTKKQSWTTSAGGTYVGWIKLIEWTPSKAGQFSIRNPILFSIYRSYNSPSPECYLLSISASWDSSVSINLLQGVGSRIIKNFRFTRNEDKTKYWFEMYVDETQTTYVNTCYCSIFGYDSFTGTLLSNTLQTATVTSLKSIQTVNNGIVADNFIGNASTATKLETARSVQVNLASTSSSSFDGTAGINPGVTGVLKVGNGGTGASDHVANRLVWSESASKIRASYHYADSTKVAINSTQVPNTNFYVSGTSTFNGDVFVDTNNEDRFFTFNHTGSDGYNWRIGYLGAGAGEANYLVFQSNKTDGTAYYDALRFGLSTLDAAFGGNVYPLVDNTQTLGTSTFKWATVYATQFEGNAKSATQLITERVLKIGNTGKTFNGTKNVTWTNNEIGFLDLVNRGEELADEIDINNVGYGNFYSNNSTKSATLINGPLTSAGFRLISMKGYNSSATAYHWQFATTSTRKIYQRYRDGDNAWSGWGTIVLNPSTSAVGSSSLPVYVSGAGVATACTASELFSKLSWTGGTTAGPVLNVTVAGQARTATIPSASTSASGIVTTGAQRFRGSKTLEYPKICSNNTRYQGYHYVNNAGTILGEHWYDVGDPTNFSTGKYYWRQWSPNSTANTTTSGYHETYSLPTVTAGLTANKSYEIFTSKSYTTLDSRYVNASGDTMTGVLTFKNATATPAKGTILNCIRGQYQNAAGNYYTINLVDLVASAEADTTISSGYARFGSSNGSSFFTAGESGLTMPKALADAGALAAENAYITSDSSIIMYAGCANDAASYTKAMTITSSKVTSHVVLYGAVWNDYAEYRICKDDFKPGQVVLENGDDTMSISNNRLQRGCSIISDTFGFAIGETDEAKCPIAVSGRVLAYGYESREEFKKHIGWPVCSGPNGTVSIMTEEEEEKYPSRIIGTISAVPDYETWGTEEVEVNGRIWIKVK